MGDDTVTALVHVALNFQWERLEEVTHLLARGTMLLHFHCRCHGRCLIDDVLGRYHCDVSGNRGRGVESDVWPARFTFAFVVVVRVEVRFSRGLDPVSLRSGEQAVHHQVVAVDMCEASEPVTCKSVVNEFRVRRHSDAAVALRRWNFLREHIELQAERRDVLTWVHVEGKQRLVQHPIPVMVGSSLEMDWKACVGGHEPNPGNR